MIHEKLRSDVDEAHGRIRLIEEDIGTLKSTGAANAAKMDALIEKVDNIAKGQDVILGHILERQR